MLSFKACATQQKTAEGPETTGENQWFQKIQTGKAAVDLDFPGLGPRDWNSDIYFAIFTHRQWRWSKRRVWERAEGLWQMMLCKSYFHRTVTKGSTFYHIGYNVHIRGFINMLMFNQLLNHYLIRETHKSNTLWVFTSYLSSTAQGMQCKKKWGSFILTVCCGNTEQHRTKPGIP